MATCPQNSLGGNTKTAIICTVTPAEEVQTKSTLDFATRAKKIVQKANVNLILDDKAKMNRLRKENAELQNEVNKLKNNEMAELNEQLKKQIEDLRVKLQNNQNQFINSTLPPQRKTLKGTWPMSSLHKVNKQLSILKMSTISCHFPKMSTNSCHFLKSINKKDDFFHKK